MKKTSISIISAIFSSFIVAILILVFFSIETVQPGYVKVATLFGNVKNTYTEGLHFVNPFYKFHGYDVREKTHLSQDIQVPSNDQLLTKFDISINYKIDKNQVAKILAETGDVEVVILVHLIPTFRSLLREVGKGVKTAEEFYSKEIQQKIQDDIFSQLSEYCFEKGLIVQKVLIRKIELPEVITLAVEKKKRRQQLAEEQKAELIRFKVEQEQKLAQAQAERAAAEEEAKQIRLLADANAYKITKINEAIANNASYIQLKAVESLKEISKNPAAQIYFLNSDSPQPFPFLNLGKKLAE